jgi:hypothetical protein
VITTYHGYIPILDQVRGRFRFKYINPISDPVSLHPILYSHTADYNIGFDEACRDFGGRMNIPPERIMPSGWFTSRRFFEQQPVASIRQELGLQDHLTLMVCAGSEGNQAVLSLLPVLLFTRHPRAQPGPGGCHPALLQAGGLAQPGPAGHGVDRIYRPHARVHRSLGCGDR